MKSPVTTKTCPQSSRRRRDLRALVTGLAAVLAAGARGEPALEAVVSEARERNPGVQAARAAWEAARRRVAVARSLPDPVAGLGVHPSHAGIETRRGVIGRQFTVEQRVPFPAKLLLDGGIAKARARAAEAAYHEARLDVDARVTRAYADLAYLDASIAVNDEQVLLLGQFARVAERKYSTGGRRQGDVFRAQLELAKAVNDLETLRNERTAAEAGLNALLDREPDFPVETATLPPVPEYAVATSAMLAAAVRHSPELAGREAEVDGGRLGRHRALTEFLPDLGFGYQFTRIDPLAGAPGADGRDAEMAFVKLTVPLWLGRNVARVREASARLEAAEASLRDARNRVKARVVALASKVETHHRVSRLFRDTVIPLAEGTLSSMRRAYEADRASFLDLLDAERSLLEIRLEYRKHAADFFAVRAELERVIGVPLNRFGGDDDEHS